MIKISKIRDFIFENKKEMLFAFLLLIGISWVLLTTPPNNFNVDTYFEIEEGETLKAISEKLKEQNLIKSQVIFSSILILQGKDDNLVAGEYVFHNKQDVFSIANRLTMGDYGIKSIEVTLPEGITLNQMTEIFDDKFVNFNEQEFEIETSLDEGYYFPDTYFFPENADAELIAKTLRNNFDKKIESIDDFIKASVYDLREIIIMASIIEKEATAETRQDIANILWKRMEIGMPLQVDATFVYERGKGTFDLSTSDLRTDSPYNTYTNAGLPPTPIANPGLDAIKAAAQPEETDYLFFLTGSDGEMYYAETHDQHVLNKQNFLR